MYTGVWYKATFSTTHNCITWEHISSSSFSSIFSRTAFTAAAVRLGSHDLKCFLAQQFHKFKLHVQINKKQNLYVILKDNVEKLQSLHFASCT